MRMCILVITKYTRTQFSLAVAHANKNTLVYEFFVVCMHNFSCQFRIEQDMSKEISFSKISYFNSCASYYVQRISFSTVYTEKLNTSTKKLKTKKLFPLFLSFQIVTFSLKITIRKNIYFQLGKRKNQVQCKRSSKLNIIRILSFKVTPMQI